MRVLFVSGELIAGGLAHKLQKEGCEVKLFIEDENRKECFDGILEKTVDWKKELDWVGKDGIIVFDDVGYGKEQDDLRKQGYVVFGGCEEGDKLEQDREYGQKIFSELGMDTVEAVNFSSCADAIKFVKQNPAEWVVKQTDHANSLNYVGNDPSGSDVIGILESYSQIRKLKSIHLQKKVKGIDIGISRFFNGKDWVGPIYYNIEQKKICNGDLGPMSGGMGSLGWCSEEEKSLLFKETLLNLSEYLRNIHYVGRFSVDFIVSNNKVIPIDITSRFGCPFTYLQIELNSSLWKNYLLRVASGKNYQLKYNNGYAMVISIVVPPFPYKTSDSLHLSRNFEIFFKNLTQKEKEQIHFEEVKMKKYGNKERYFIAGDNGYVLYVTGKGKAVEQARKSAYKVVNKIVIPKMFYRTDIGEKFLEKNQEFLRKRGWI